MPENGNGRDTGVTDERPRRGPPFGNTNGFTTGTSLLKRAAKAKLRPRHRKIAVEVANRLTEHLGGRENISEAQRIIIAITARQCGRLDKVHRCYDRLLKGNPDLYAKPGALHKIDSMLGPMEQRVVSNLVTLGLKRISKPRDIYSWQSPGEGDGDGGDNGKADGDGQGEG